MNYLGILIGNPVDKSVSHITHPRIFREMKVDATYKKMLLEPDMFKEEIKRVKECYPNWIAVTMPFKECVLPYLDDTSDEVKEIQAVNTIIREEGKWIGRNTDGMGCLNAIEHKVRVENKHVLILGAGGASRAVIYEAKKRGAKVSLWNRTKEKGEMLAKKFSIEHKKEIDKEDSFDIVINTSSMGMSSDQCSLDTSFLKNTFLAMDIVSHPLETKFLQEAKKRNCICVNGLSMFIELSFLQFSFVFPFMLPKENFYVLMQQEALALLTKGSCLPRK